MNYKDTALILIGYQNDYFEPDGILRGVVEESVTTNNVLENTLKLIDDFSANDGLIISTPILFSEDYRELTDPKGLMAIIKEVGAFRENSPGGKTIKEFAKYGDKITEISGKTGFNAFAGTDLNGYLKERGIKNVAIAGVVCSVCIDSTGRAADERGYNVTMLKDTTAGRSAEEYEIYTSAIFPIYANVVSVDEFICDIKA